MTDAADRTVWEADEDALYRSTRGQISTHSPEQAVSGSTDADAATGAREARYAEALIRTLYGGKGPASPAVIRAVLAVADEDLAGLRAEVERLRARVHEVADEQQRRFAPYVSRCDRFDATRDWARQACGFTVDGRGVERPAWLMTSEAIRTVVLAERERAEAAEAELRALREGIEGLHQEAVEDCLPAGWCEEDGRPWPCSTAALLASSPAATTGEAASVRSGRYPCTCPDDFETDTDCEVHTKPHPWQRDWGVEPNAEADAQFKAGNAAIRAAQAAVDLTAPVSSGAPVGAPSGPELRLVLALSPDDARLLHGDLWALRHVRRLGRDDIRQPTADLLARLHEALYDEPEPDAPSDTEAETS